MVRPGLGQTISSLSSVTALRRHVLPTDHPEMRISSNEGSDAGYRQLDLPRSADQ